jgi:branched-chain amino acid transport system substrate-binding protein
VVSPPRMQQTDHMDMWSRVFLALGTVTWALGACAGPAQGGPPAGAPPPAPIKIGVLDDITGVTSIEGALMRISTELVVQQTNSTGGINGHPIQVLYADPRDDPSQAIQLAMQLVEQDKVDVLAGAVTIPECLGVQSYAAKAHVVYVPLNGCGDQLTKACDRYTFRVYPGSQTGWIASAVKTYGKRWGVIYADYAIGQILLAQTRSALQSVQAGFAVEIAVPFGEPNVTPYVTRIPTDGSIDFLVLVETGTDLAHVMSVIQQFGINQKVSIFAGAGKDAFGGTYPDVMNGALIVGYRPSEGVPGNADDTTFEQAWKTMAHQNADITAPLGGADNATPGIFNGYVSYVSMTALKLAMRVAGFAGRADTEKLIRAFEGVNMAQGPDAPDGPMLMNKDNHQGRLTAYLLKIDGQQEDILQTFPADSQPVSADCKVGGA